MLEKHIYATEVYDETGTTLLSLWRDIEVPSFTYDAQGPKTYQFTMVREYGRADAPGDINSRGSLKNGNQILVRIADDTYHPTSDNGYQNIAGIAVPGKMVVGGAVTFGHHLLYGGNIIDHEYIDQNTVRVEAISFGSLLETPIDESAPFNLTGDPVELAKYLINTYADGTLTWDHRNPSRYSTTSPPFSFTFQPGPLSIALEDIRKTCGPNWFCYATPQRTIRFFEANTITPDHRMIVGVHALHPIVRLDATNVRKKITVIYGSGGSTGIVSEQASDYTAAYPRHELVRAEHIADAGTARRYARTLLKSHARDERRGTVRIIDTRAESLRQYGITKGYHIESIEVGDTIQLNFERPIDNINQMIAGLAIPGKAQIGYAGYGENLVVHSIQWEFNSILISFSRPQPTIEQDMINAERMIQRIRNRS